MELGQLLETGSNVIFPVFIAVYLLWDKKNTQEKNNDILQNLSNNILENTTILKQLFQKLDKE